MRLTFLRSTIFLIAVAVIFVVGAVAWLQIPLAQHQEWRTYDWRMQLAHSWDSRSRSAATNMGLIAVTDQTIADVNNGQFGFRFGLYWPRQVYARGLAELTQQGAKAVGFDVLFGEARPDQPPVELPDGTSISSDQFFVQQLRASSNVILAATPGLLPNPVFATNAWKLGDIATRRDADGVLRRVAAFRDCRQWHPIILQVAGALDLDLEGAKIEPGKIIFPRAGLSNEPIVFPTDAQGRVDTTTIVNPVPSGVPPLFFPFQTVRLWNMGIIFAAAQLKLNLDKSEIDLAHHRLVLHGENSVTRVVPVDAEGRFYVDWSTGLNDTNLARGAFESLLSDQEERAQGNTPKNIWRDKLVVIGSTATGNDLTDVGATPLAADSYMVSTHWNVANSIITNRFIQILPRWGELILIIAVGFISAWITWITVRPVFASFLMALAALVYVGLAVFVFVQWRLWIPIMLPLVCAGFVTHFSALSYRLTVEQSEKKRIRSLFSRMVSPEVVNQVLGAKSISLGSLSGERRQITVFFADIRGFTALTDAIQSAGTDFVRKSEMNAQVAERFYEDQAREIMQTVSLYLGAIADCVKKHHGTLDKYIGDCVMAFWGAPLENPHNALAAVRCAIEAQKTLHALNEKREEENRRRERENAQNPGATGLPLLPILSMGTGINTGMVIAGFMGSQAHIVNYTVFGREVNLASRLEGISGHGRIIIGEGTHAALARDDATLAAACREQPAQIVKGFREQVRIFEVPWKTSLATEAPQPDLNPGG